MTEGSVSAAGRSKYATVSCETFVPARSRRRQATASPRRRRPRRRVRPRSSRATSPATRLPRRAGARGRGPVLDREATGERGERPVGPDDAAVDLEHDLTFELDAKAPPGFARVEHLVLGGAGIERRPKGRAVAARVEQAGEREQLGSRLLLQLPPQRQRLLRERHPLRLGVREAEDARRAVARSVRMADLELLEHGDVAAGAPSAQADARPITPAPTTTTSRLGGGRTTAWPLPREMSQRLTG